MCVCVYSFVRSIDARFDTRLNLPESLLSDGEMPSDMQLCTSVFVARSKGKGVDFKAAIGSDVQRRRGSSDRTCLLTEKKMIFNVVASCMHKNTLNRLPLTLTDLYIYKAFVSYKGIAYKVFLIFD